MTTPTNTGTTSADAAAAAPTYGQRVARDGDAAARLSAIADLIEACPVPDVFNGYDLCGHAQPWPCPVTLAAWLARGLHPAVELAAELATARDNAASNSAARYRYVALDAEIWLDDLDDPAQDGESLDRSDGDEDAREVAR
jgi:hypothetical protein